MRLLYAGLIFLTFFFATAAARADCPTVTAGLKPTGHVFYNVDHDVMQICRADGQWYALHGFTVGGPPDPCAPPPLCPEPGDVCDDGNPGTPNDPIFAGMIGCERLYVADSQSTGAAWAVNSGIDNIVNDSVEDGRINDAEIPDDPAFPAFKLCKDLADGGFTDWYLPARDELAQIAVHFAAINAHASVPLDGGDYYQSSSETGTDHHWRVNLGHGHQFNSGWKPDAGSGYPTRCVRRD